MRNSVVEKVLSDFSGNYARFLARHPAIFIAFPVLLTVILSLGICFKFNIVKGVHYLYSPIDAESKIEESVFQRFWASNDNRFYPGKDVLLRKGFYVIVSAKDGGNVLRPELSNEMVHLLDSISNSTFFSGNGEIIHFDQVCLHFQNQCFSNTHVRMLSRIFSRTPNSINVTYPLFATQFLTEPLNLQSILGGVELDGGFVSSAKVWMLIYQLKQQTQKLNQLSSEFQQKLPELIENVGLNGLNVSYFHSEIFDDELARNTMEMAPRFCITFAILIIFSIVCTFTLIRIDNTWYVIDWVISKPLLGIAGVISTLMAIVSSIGLLLLMDVVFVDICAVMPFLALSIGTDDAFLLLAAWRETDCSESVEIRIEKTLKHSGVAILITSLADSLAFLVGGITSMPAVKYFSLYSSVAIFFIYIYTISLFSAIMVLQGRWEQISRNSVWGCKTRAELDVSWFSKIFNMGSRHKFKKHSLWYQKIFAGTFCDCISHPIIQWTALISYTIYISFTVYGLTQLDVGFDLMNIVKKGSSTEHFIQLRTKYFIEDVSNLDVAVLNPPNMGNKTQRVLFLTDLNRLENAKCSTGRPHTKFWFFNYKEYLNNMGFGTFNEDTDLNYTLFRQQIEPFLLNSAKDFYDIIEEKNGSLSKFRLSIGLISMKNDRQILECAKEIRNICKESKFEIQTYSTLWNLADQFDIIWPQTLQDVLISVVIMFIIGILFISPTCSIVIVLSILSVSFGVLGLLHFLNAKLDPTSMITLAMSVGFSVDFASHVTYAFISVDSSDPMIKLRGALRSVGWPITQTSSAVLFGIITLGTVRNQLVQTVFKAVLLVIVFGSIHALVYIPLLLLKVQQIWLFLNK